MKKILERFCRNKLQFFEFSASYFPQIAGFLSLALKFAWKKTRENRLEKAWLS